MSTRLLADIGGTWARFALLVDGTTGPIDPLSTGAYATPVDAIRHFLAERRIDRLDLSLIHI